MREFLLAAANGQRIAETALAFGVSEETVKTIRAEACRRAGVRTVTAAVYLLGRGELH